MIWVAWKQHRVGVFTALGVIVAAIGLMLVVRLSIGSSLSDMGAGECLSNPSACDTDASMMVLNSYGSYVSLWPMVLYILPVVVGVVAGAPLFARELSQGSHVFSLTQSISRKRWWASKLVVSLVPVTVGIGLLGLFSLWALGPVLDLLGSRMQPGNFEVQGTVMLGYLVLAFATSATLGLMTRNNVVPMVITVGIYLVLAYFIVDVVRPLYLPPSTKAVEQTEADGIVSGVPDDAWQVGETYETEDGKRVEDLASYCTMDECDYSEFKYAIEEYHPSSSFWAFQGIETGGYLVLAAGALAVGARRLRTLP